MACAETYAIIESISTIYQVWQRGKHHYKLAIKPANGSGGGGIMILKKNVVTKQWKTGGQFISEEQIYKHCADILSGVYSLGTKDRVLIEYCIEPHPFFHELYPKGVPDFRVILMNDQPIMSMLRLPTDRSKGKANIHQGGLGIGIDMETGQLKAAFDGNQYHDYHPDCQSQIKGRKLPYWEETLQLAIDTSKAFPLGYLGIDIVIDKNLGPLVMEINVRPGLAIQLANKTLPHTIIIE